MEKAINKRVFNLLMSIFITRKEGVSNSQQAKILITQADSTRYLIIELI
jgi:hypothetical protein